LLKISSVSNAPAAGQGKGEEKKKKKGKEKRTSVAPPALLLTKGVASGVGQWGERKKRKEGNAVAGLYPISVRGGGH